MAKDQKKKKKNVVELTPAEKFVQAQTLKRAVRCMLVEQDVYDVYVKLTKDFADLAKIGEETPFEGSDQCMELSQECARLAEEWKKTHSMERIVESRTVTTSARERETQGTDKKKGKGKWIALAALVLVVGFIICYNVDVTRYQIAGLEQLIGFDDLAKASYEKLGAYKDCEDKIIDIQKKEILKAKKGATVKFGSVSWKNGKGETVTDDCTWIVLDKQGDSVLLSKFSAMNDLPYHDSNADVTWADCNLRKELNSTFLNQTFSDKEKEMIQMTEVKCNDNETYQTKGGETTSDQIFIMNEEEVRQYRKQLGVKLKTMRLRTPGKDRNTTTYVSALGVQGKDKKEVDIIDYGFPVERNGACVRPTMWVTCR